MKHKRLCEEGFGEKGNYTIILPIDQGVEHGPVDAFYATDHPEMLDIDYQVDFIAELLHEGLVGATALPKRTANLLCKKYPHLAKDVILKLNHGNNLNQNLLHINACVSFSTSNCLIRCWQYFFKSFNCSMSSWSRIISIALT